MKEFTEKIIHAARVTMKQRTSYLLLKQTGDQHFCWMELDGVTEKKTPVASSTAEDAIRLARRHWRHKAFRTINCGFRYTLPERDEHGLNALFHQMAASYSSMNGIYFDPDIGNNCIVNFASEEARNLWKSLKLIHKA